MKAVAVTVVVANIRIRAILKVALFYLLSTGIVMATENNKTLALCPESPNCVSTQAQDEAHFIAPFKVIVSMEKAWERLQTLLNHQPRTKIIEVTENQLQVEVTSLVFRFVDDVQIILDADKKLLHIRSASRTGHSDFGVNRKRVESLKTQLQHAKIIE